MSAASDGGYALWCMGKPVLAIGGRTPKLWPYFEGLPDKHYVWVVFVDESHAIVPVEWVGPRSMFE